MVLAIVQLLEKNTNKMNEYYRTITKLNSNDVEIRNFVITEYFLYFVYILFYFVLFCFVSF